MAKPDITAPKQTWLSIPGDSIQAGIDAMAWTKRHFAERMGYSEKHVNLLLSAKVPITPDAAQRLSRVLGGAVEYWLTREAQYQGELARRKEEKTLANWVGWLDGLPRSYLRKLGLIQAQRKGTDQVRECLSFYGVASPKAWQDWNSTLQASFRSSSAHQEVPSATSTWLRVGELKAAEIECQPFEKSLFQEALPQLRALTTEKNPKVFLPKMTDLCALAGVSLVNLPTPAGCVAFGATRWLSPHKALLMLSNRYKTDDQWWFSFFHECGHLLLHSKKSAFVDSAKSVHSKEEDQANRFAAKVLIPDSHQAAFAALSGSKRDIQKFSKQIGVPPGVVVGRLQHEKRIPFSRHNDLKVQFQDI